MYVNAEDLEVETIIVDDASTDGSFAIDLQCRGLKNRQATAQKIANETST